MALKKPVAELTDQELEAELRERRQRRAERVLATGAPLEDEAPRPRIDVAQALANLELPAAATFADVEAKYRSLMERYSPERHAKDPERHRAALELSARLTRAYQVLYEALKR